MKKATHQQTKEHNRNLVLRTIFERDPISRAEIARITGLTRATVSDIVAELLNEGLVSEIGVGESIGGKAPILLSLEKDSRYLIGLYLAEDQFIGSIINLRGEIKDTIEIPILNRSGEQALRCVYDLLDLLTTKAYQPIVGIGIATPGLVNTKEGIVINAVNLDWKDLALSQMLQEHYHIPVSVLNDSQAAAIGEFVYGGNHPPESNLIVINIKYGIGAGVLINGCLFQGDGGGAGEIGHVVVEENGSLCRCGKKGCLETVASAKAILQRTLALLPEYPHSTLSSYKGNLSLENLAAAWQNQDPLATLVVSEAIHYLGIAIANLVSVLNIHEIVITGDITRLGDIWLAQVYEAMQKSALAKLAQDTHLEFGKLGFKSFTLGASAYMLLGDYHPLFMQSQLGA
ncbi:MAG: ROK family transcriptional regulator [Anaerolineales bacterium]